MAGRILNFILQVIQVSFSSELSLLNESNNSKIYQKMHHFYIRFTPVTVGYHLLDKLLIA